MTESTPSVPSPEGSRRPPRRRALTTGTVAAVAILAAACGSSSSSSGTTATSAATGATVGSTTSTTSTTSATKPTGTPGPVVIAAATRGTVGVVLTDGIGGPTLYRYTPDGTGLPSCTAACARAWPPLTTGSASGVSAGTGVAASNLGTAIRAGDILQVTFKGMPLYTFSGDTQPAQTSGQGVGGVWYVVHPADPAQASTSTTSSTKIAPY